MNPDEQRSRQRVMRAVALTALAVLLGLAAPGGAPSAVRAIEPSSGHAADGGLVSPAAAGHGGYPNHAGPNGRAGHSRQDGAPAALTTDTLAEPSMSVAQAGPSPVQPAVSPVPTPGPIVPRGNPVGTVGIVAMVVVAAAGLWIYRVIRKGL